MQWRWLAVSLALAVSACSAGVAAPGPVGSPGPERSAIAAGMAANWYSVAGGCPTLSGPGHERITDGIFGLPNGFDDANLYEVSCHYGKLAPNPTVSVSITIYRKVRSGNDARAELQSAESVAKSAGHLIVPLTGVGDGGNVVAAKKSLGDPHPVVLASAWSRNAYVTANVRLDSPIYNEADLATQAPALTAVLSEVIDDLRP